MTSIRSRRVLIGAEGEPRPATIVIRDGKIAEILDHSAPVEHDVGDLLVMPGIVDTHAHINEPGRTDWEGFKTATQAAAAGGITTVVDMPLNSIPATTTLEALEIKARTAKGQCLIDYGFWGGVIPGNSRELAPMAAAGALGFKAFLCESGVAEFPMSREKDLEQAMPILAEAGVPLLVHAELADDRKSGPDYEGYLGSRPPEWEVNAIRMMIRLAEKTSCKVHIVHLSAADAVADIRAARIRGVPITAETCPHYLVFESETIGATKTQFKCSPPIRGHENRERLWQSLKEGAIDFVVSDHSPCTPELKRGDFSQAWGGIAGLQFSLPAVWTEMKRRGHTVRELSSWMSDRTSRFAGLGDRKGRIAVGYDADLVVFDPEASFRVEPSMILHRNKLTPYEGLELRGKVSRTYLRGNCIYTACDGFAGVGLLKEGTAAKESLGRQVTRVKRS
jgi:allantoinase